MFRPQNCLFDLANVGKSFAAGIYQGGGQIYGDDCKVMNAALNFHDQFTNTTYARWRRCFFKDFGKKALWNANPDFKDHCEPFHPRKGTLELDRCRIDNLGNTLDTDVATSSGPFVEADGADVNLIMTSSGIISKGANGRLYGAANYGLDSGALLGLSYDAYATQGSLSATLGAVTLAGTATVGRATQGSLSATLGAVTLSATGGNGSPTLTIYWSGTDKGADQVRSNNNLTISSTSNGGRQLARTNTGVVDGIKRYFELKIESAASGMAIGVCRGDAPLGTSLGGADESVAIQFNGDVQRSGSVIGDTGGNLTAGEYIGVMMNTFNDEVSFIRGGTEYGPYHTLSIANVSDPYAAVGVEHNTATAGVTLNTGSSAFNDSLPSGYTAWGP